MNEELVNSNTPSPNRDEALLAKMRHVFSEQRRLRELLEQTRSELDEINRQVLQLQKDYCTDAVREEEYNCCLEIVLGYDPRTNPADFEGALSCGETLEDLIRELEGQAGLTDSREVA